MEGKQNTSCKAVSCPDRLPSIWMCEEPNNCEGAPSTPSSKPRMDPLLGNQEGSQGYWAKVPKVSS